MRPSGNRPQNTFASCGNSKRIDTMSISNQGMEFPDSGNSVSIYNRDSLEYTPTSKNFTLKQPFHLSKSNQYRNRVGFTGKIPNEQISYIAVTTVVDFLSIVRLDCSGTEFQDNRRGKTRFISSDVLCFDVDNDDKSKQVEWNDPDSWLTIDKFTNLFSEYEFLISTSQNHQKEKNGREPRDRYHVFLPLDRAITDRKEHEYLLDMIDFFTRQGEENSRIDSTVGSVSQIWGYQDTSIFYNEGKSINELLHQEDFQDDYGKYKKDSKSRYGKNQSYNGNYEISSTDLMSDWDYIHIISKFDLSEFYPTMQYRSGGYFMGNCELHPDERASLQIFDNGGFNCFGCNKSHISALEYVARKKGQTQHQIRKEYCRQLGLDSNRFLIWLNQKKSNSTTTIEKNEDSTDQSDDDPSQSVDPYPYAVTSTNDIFVDQTTYEELELLNQKQAILSQDGRTTVMLWETTRHTDWKEVRFDSKIADMVNRYKNQRKKTKQFNSQGKEIYKVMSMGQIWELWEHRRQYDGIDFYPSTERNPKYDDNEIMWDMWDDWSTAAQENKWQGDLNQRGLIKFLDHDTLNMITPDRSFTDLFDGCSNYLMHLHDVICGNYTGNKHTNLMNYILGWMSKALTHHTSGRVKIGLVLKGGQGTGKGTMASLFGQLFGRHYLHIIDSDRLVQQFNLQMLDKLMVFVDESVFAGDKKVENQLKGKITEDEMTVEPKYLNSFSARCYHHYIFASNENWAVPQSWDDRRYMTIDVADTHSGGSTDYFDTLYDQWKKGGKEHLFKFLTSDRIMKMADEINYEKDRPVTRASIEQKLMGDPVSEWFHRILQDGGHQAHDSMGQRKIQLWKEQEENNFYEERYVIHETFRRHMLNKGLTYNKDLSHLTQGLHRLAGQGLIIFSNPRCDKKKYGTSNSWRFSSMENLKKLWVDKVWDGNETDAWGEFDIDGSDEHAPTTEEQQLTNLILQSKKNQEMRFNN